MNITTRICRTWDESVTARETLRADVAFWNSQSAMPLKWVGYNNLFFDCPTVETHQRLDGLPTFGMDIRKYGSKNVIDLFDALTYSDNCGKQVLRRTLHDLCAAFGIDPTGPEEIDGSEVQGRIDAGDYEAVAAHCQHDTALTAALYQRVMPSPFRAVVFDVETVKRDGLDLARVKVDSRLTDPAKIAKAKAEAPFGLDPFASRIVALCWTLVDGNNAEMVL